MSLFMHLKWQLNGNKSFYFLWDKGDNRLVEEESLSIGHQSLGWAFRGLRTV